MTRVSRHAGILSLLLLLVPCARAQDVTGDWYGMLDPDEIGLRTTLHVSATEVGYSATVDSPDQGAFGIPLDSFEMVGNRVTFGFPRASITYEGTIDEGSTSIHGTLTQADEDMPLDFGRVELEPLAGPRWAADRLDKTEVYITMRDGVRLFTSIYAPKDRSKAYPVIVNRTPYNIEPEGAERFSGKIAGFRHFLEDGYILVLQDVRGRYMSEGTYENIRPCCGRRRDRRTSTSPRIPGIRSTGW